MAFSRSRILALGTALALSGCSFTSDALWPSLSGEAAPQQAQQAPAKADGQPAAAQATAGMSSQPALGTTNFEPTGVSQGAPTGTYVGQKVVQLREELQKLQNNISGHNQSLQELRVKTIQDSQRYHGTVAAINARLQVGTTKGNPILVQQFNSAQTDIDQIAADVTAMNALANSVAEDSTMAEYLAESTQAAFGVSGAVDEDHEQLAALQDDVRKTVVLIERLLKELSEDVRRQTNYLASERANLNTLLAGVKTGELYGQSLTSKTFATQQEAMSAPAANDSRRPLVVIRFDKANINYQQPLYTAVNRVLERRPNATFDLVAVAPASGGPAQMSLNAGKARRHAENVLRALTDMGLPAERVTLSARTSSQAKSNEVHVYLR